jgi:hypothetical protein
MRAILLLIAMFSFEGIAVAGAKLTAKPIYEMNNNEFKWQVGLSVNQQILPKFNYVGWYGLGFFPESHEQDWQKMEQGFEYYCGLLSVGSGVHYTYTPEAKTEAAQKDWDLYSTVSLKLW